MNHALYVMVFIINHLPLCLVSIINITACLDRHLIMKVLDFHFMFAHIFVQLHHKLAPNDVLILLFIFAILVCCLMTMGGSN